MAYMTATDIADILMTQYGSYIAETVVQGGPGNDKIIGRSLFGVLQEYGRVFIGGADNNNRYVKDWGVHASTATAESYGPNDPNPAATQEGWDAARIDWKRARVALEYDRLVRLQQQGDVRGGQNAVNLDFEAKTKALVHKINAMLATDGTGNSNKDFTGFLAFLSASNTYANIAQGPNAYWQAYVLAAGGASLSLSTHLEVMMGNLVDRDAIAPSSVLLFSRTQWLKYKALFEDNLRYVPREAAGTAIAPVYEDGDVSLPIRVCGGVPATEIWHVVMDELSLRFLDQVPEDELASVDPLMQIDREGIPFGLTVEPTGRDSAGLVLRAYGNLQCDSPKHTGIISGLAI